DVDVEKERISLGIKQLAGDPLETAGDLKKGAVVTCEVTEVKEGGIDVKIVGTDLTTFIKRSELARDRGEQRPERFSLGQKVDAPRAPGRPPHPQGAGLDQGARGGGGEGGDCPIRLDRCGGNAWRYSGHGTQARHGKAVGEV